MNAGSLTYAVAGVSPARARRRMPLGALLLLCLAATARAAAPGDALTPIFEAYDEASLELSPLLATLRGDRRYDDQLGDGISEAWLARDEALVRDCLARLDAVDRDRLTAREQVSYDTFRHKLELRRDDYAAGFARADALMPITQSSGLHLGLPQLGAEGGIQPLDEPDDHERWLARAAQWPRWVEQAIANMRRGIETGIVLPRVVAERILPQLEAHIVEDPVDSVFWDPARALAADEAGAALAARYRTLIEQSIVPAYRRLDVFMREEYLPHTRTTVGRAALPNGRAWYEQDIRRHTTLPLTAAEIHQRGLDEVARLLGELDSVRARLGFDGDRQDFLASLRTDDRWHFASADEALEAYRRMKDRVRPRLPELFGKLPRADYEIRPVEAFRAASAAGANYRRTDGLGNRPGVFFLNTSDLSRIPTFELTALSLHEAEPGHHLQTALAAEAAELPAFQRFEWVTAFGEGWALYAETLGTNMGLYVEPAQYLGFLHSRLFRANRLVIDTGLHALGWSRERAIRQFLENSPLSEAEARAEVERYIVWPGQALAYLTGALEIERLRAEAQRTLGPRFDLRAFHDEILSDGTIPLPVLQAKLARWAQERAERAP